MSDIKHWTIRTFAILCLALMGHAISVAPSMQFQRNSSIVGNNIYNLFWTIDGDTITFEVHVKTLGYVGFGISRTGGMKDADIVMGWVKDGKVYFQDRFSSRNAEPTIDKSQDWKLLGGREEDQYTILTFSRPLTNCDPDDIDITPSKDDVACFKCNYTLDHMLEECFIPRLIASKVCFTFWQDTTRVIYSFHDQDPIEATGVAYHGSRNRGSKSLSLVNFDGEETQHVPEDSFYIDLRLEKVQVPAKHTTYYCRGIKTPKLDKKHHVFMVEPLIEKGHEGIVHHFIAYSCPGHINDTRYETANGVCWDEVMKELRECFNVAFAYAVGSGPTYLPKEAGFPLFGGEFFRLEMHYDNPSPSQAGIIDSSGVRLWLTPTLRKYDAATLTVAITTSRESHIIPPGFKALHNEAYCHNGCLKLLMGSTTEVQAFSALMHTHLLGTSITIRHFRDGVELPPILQDKNYDFNFQEFRRLRQPVTIKATDELIVDCVYKSDGKSDLTFGGESTQEEMCFGFIQFYPQFSTGKTNCYSVMPPAEMMKYLKTEIRYTGKVLEDFEIVGSEYEGKNYIDIMRATDWTNKETRERFQNAMLDPTVTRVQLCPAFPFHYMPFKMNKVRETYRPPELCASGQVSRWNLAKVSTVILMTLFTILHKVS